MRPFNEALLNLYERHALGELMDDLMSMRIPLRLVVLLTILRAREQYVAAKGPGIPLSWGMVKAKVLQLRRK